MVLRTIIPVDWDGKRVFGLEDTLGIMFMSVFTYGSGDRAKGLICPLPFIVNISRVQVEVRSN